MRVIHFRSIIILFSLIVFTGCKLTKVLPSNTPVENFRMKELKKAIKSSSSNFKLFRSRLKVVYNDGSRQQQLIVNLRMKENEAIWLSATMLIPIAKLLIEPENISFYEKFQKTSYQGDLNFLNNYSGTDFNYKNIERLFLGKSIIDLNKANLTQIKNPRFYVISVKNKKDVIQPILFYDPTTFMLKEQRLFITKNNSFISIMYDDFQSVDGELVPSKIEISFSNEKIRRKLTIEYTRSEIPANLTFPFKIPADYKKIIL